MQRRCARTTNSSCTPQAGGTSTLAQTAQGTTTIVVPCVHYTPAIDAPGDRAHVLVSAVASSTRSETTNQLAAF